MERNHKLGHKVNGSTARRNPRQNQVVHNGHAGISQNGCQRNKRENNLLAIISAFSGQVVTGCCKKEVKNRTRKPNSCNII